MEFDELNHSELVELAQYLDPEAHRGLPREQLISLLESEGGNNLPTRIVNKHRLKIMQVILGDWEAYEALLSCPAKTKDPNACFGCTDLQVVDCMFRNPVFTEKETT